MTVFIGLVTVALCCMLAVHGFTDEEEEMAKNAVDMLGPFYTLVTIKNVNKQVVSDGEHYHITVDVLYNKPGEIFHGSGEQECYIRLWAELDGSLFMDYSICEDTV